MSDENLLILLGALMVVAKLFYEVGRTIGRGEMRVAHDLYQMAAKESDPEKRIEMINEANSLAFPNQQFTKAFQIATRK